MSLINQVLRDLDQRHAAAGVMPSAVKTPAAISAARPRRSAIAMAAAALVVLAGGASTLAWSLASRSAAKAPPSVAAAPAHAPAPAPASAAVPAASPASAPALTPVIVVTAPPAASSPAVAAATTVANARIAASAALHAAARVAAPSAEAAPAPVNSLDVPHTPTAAAAPAAAAPRAAPPHHGDALIEKRAPARTAHERAEAHYQRGIAAHQQGQLNDASAAYAAALREDAGLAGARQALAGILVGQGRMDDAKGLLGEGHALAPKHPGIAMMLARLLAERAELQRAADVLQAAAIASASPEDHAFHAAILQRLERHADAAELYSAALRVAPNNGVWWMGLGISLAAVGRNDVAREAFNRARSSGALSPELSSYVEQRLRQLL
jgi:MSHA biogenesis protein MshN